MSFFTVQAQQKSISSGDVTLKGEAARLIDKYEPYKDATLRIWEYVEMGYKEEKSAALLQELLKEVGFTIESGVAGIPTAYL